jgi:hypothetical protein
MGERRSQEFNGGAWSSAKWTSNDSAMTIRVAARHLRFL